MQKEIIIKVSPKEASSTESIKQIVASQLDIQISEIKAVRIVKRSIDARQRNVFVNLTLNIYIEESVPESQFEEIEYKNISEAPQAIVVGCGPAGLFAALRLIELGIRPIVVERGKNVRNRKKDIAQVSKNNVVNPESNYCFGEGGAGAYSDGKLYTRSKKRGNVDKILRIFCQYGASTDILIDAHPHIGTDKLPGIMGMECDHMFVDDYYEGINLFPITRIEATKRLAYLQSYLNDTKNYFTFNIACFEVEWCVVHDTVLLKLERLNTKLIDL